MRKGTDSKAWVSGTSATAGCGTDTREKLGALLHIQNAVNFYLLVQGTC